MFQKSKKLISMLIVFVITLSYMGQTLEAVANTDGLTAITNGFFSDGQMKFAAYFAENDGQAAEKVSDVAWKPTVTFEISPNDVGSGFLKDGTITAGNLHENDINFKFSKIKNIVIEEPEEDNQTEEQVENAVKENEVTSRNGQTRDVITDDEFVNEEKIIENAVQEAEEKYQELTAKDLEIEIVSDNQIKVQNIIYNTKIEVEIEYVQKENIDVSDLYKENEIKLAGTYINASLSKEPIEVSENIIVGWTGSHEFDFSSEYTKFSPFKLGDHSGIIVENKIIVKREIEAEKYLPVRQTVIEIEVPEYNGKLPETVSVQATKLMATKGEDVGEVEFGQDNWKYDSESKKLLITVTNEKDGNAVVSKGEDEYIVVYKYDDYTEDEKVSIENNIKVAQEEYSSNNNFVTTKELQNLQEIETKINDLITYNIGTTSEKLSKAPINANYNSQELVYESEFTTTVNVNILTSDVLEEFKIKSSKEVYLDKDSAEFDASQDIYYNRVKFNYSQISNMLKNGASIEIQTTSGNPLYTLNNESVQNQENCEIKLASKEKGIFIVFKNVAINGNISIEFTKAIGKTGYEKSAFNNFSMIKSYVSAELKYSNYEERYAMSEIATTKEFEKSKTVAEISLSNNNLSTLAKNDSVEAKIILNNDKQDTDLYVNPSFELVFPRYVKNVTVENISMIYGMGLEIANYEVFRQDDLVKMKIDLAGVQTKFCETVISNGTNILLNLNIELDEYTPRKQDQIKMYYYNEGVTNYESQTKWTINKPVPEGIVKDTNGFDVEMVNYQAPNGFITSNAIINYDGQASKVKSIAQGEKIVSVSENGNSQIATMELVGMNNTGNSCSEVVFMGRIPFAGNKSVVTNKNLGTTVNTCLMDSIKEDIKNANMAIIYYSTNENATKDLNDSENGWTTNVENLQNIKSYMIVVKGEMPAGNILKYTYEFEIPANLDYGAEIFGSFGGFYNNNFENAIVYESAEADKVGIRSEKEPEVEVTVAPFWENKRIYYGQILGLKVNVENKSQSDIVNALVNVSIPNNTVYTDLQVFQHTGDSTGVYDEYVDNTEVKHIEFPIESLKVGESKELEFNVRVLENADLSGTILINGLPENVKYTNSYKLTAENGKMEVKAYVPGSSTMTLSNNSEVLYYVDVTNKSGQDLNDVQAKFEFSKYLSIKEIKRKTEEELEDLKYTNENGRITANLGDIENKTTICIKSVVQDVDVAKATLKTIFDVYENKNSNEMYSSNVVQTNIEQPLIEVHQTCSANSDLKYYDEIEYRISINNNSGIAKNIKVEDEFPKTVNISRIKVIVNGVEENIEYPMNKFTKNIQLQGNDSIEIIAGGNLIDWDNENKEQTIINVAKVSLNSGESFNSNEILTNIKPIEQAEDEEEIKEVAEEVTEEVIEQAKPEQQIDNYSISGNVGIENETEAPSQVQVQLIKGATMIKATTTDSDGNYEFTDLPAGDYSVVYNYDKEKYDSATYVTEQAGSKIVEIEEGKALTDTITVSNTSIENVDLALEEKENFDLSIKQYISKAIVNVNGKEKEYEYEDLELAKLEIKPSDLEKATVKLEYKLVIENVGNVDGQVTSIVDYVPNGLTFSEKENPNWAPGVDGNVYTDILKGENIAPGEQKEITLILNKKMTEDNTGVVSNKAKIAYTESTTRLTEGKSNNFATQETIVTLTQGGAALTVFKVLTISLTSVVAIFGFMVKTGRIEISFNTKKGIKKVYK